MAEGGAGVGSRAWSALQIYSGWVGQLGENCGVVWCGVGVGSVPVCSRARCSFFFSWVAGLFKIFAIIKHGRFDETEMLERDSTIWNYIERVADEIDSKYLLANEETLTLLRPNQSASAGSPLVLVVSAAREVFW
jgi:hypothetical protein